MDWSAAAQFYKRLTHSYSSVLENKELVCSGPSYQRILLVWDFSTVCVQKETKREVNQEVFNVQNFTSKNSVRKKYTHPLQLRYKNIPKSLQYLLD